MSTRNIHSESVCVKTVKLRLTKLMNAVTISATNLESVTMTGNNAYFPQFNDLRKTACFASIMIMVGES